LRLNFADALHQHGNRVKKINAIESAVREIEDFGVANVEQGAGGGKFILAHGGEFLVRLRPTTMRGGGSRGQANNIRTDALPRRFQQEAAETPDLVIRMRSNAQQFEHFVPRPSF
jgi:hypothetical protein